MASKNEYFASLEANETAGIVLSKANLWFNNLDSNGYLDKIRTMYAAYHGAYYADVNDGHSIVFGGEQGEIANLAVNHFRNIAQHIMVMITASRPAMEARAINTDYKSLVQTKLANGLLDYYMREKRLEKHLKDAVEYSIVLGAGFIKMEWNQQGGEIYDRLDPVVDEQTGEIIEDGYPVYEGDVQFTNLSPFDVVFDSTKEGQNHDWVLTRSFKNRFDLVAKFPEFEDKILKMPTKDETMRFRFNSLAYDETDDIAVYEFYHNRTESMPEGRYMMFVDGDAVLMDAPMPYDSLPVYRIAPADILGTPYGYSPLFDLLPIQDAINSLYSTVLSNQSAFGIQNILMPRGADIAPTNLVGGLNLIEYNAQIGKPEPLNLTHTPKEIFDFIEMLERKQETLSGINSVTRGNPETNLKSGNALALVQSMALQYMSGLQQSYVLLIEDIGTGLIKMLQRFASVPRIAVITGKSNRTYMQEFTGDDLSTVSRVMVEVGNPLSKSTAGRVEMAEQMLQMGLLKTPEQYITVLTTGNLDVMTEDTQSELFLIRSENEKLVSGDLVTAVATDQHSLHIKEHKCVLADPVLRHDPALLERTLAHIQEHIDLLRTTDPDLLAMMGEQPLSPPGGSPAQQPDPNQQVNSTAMPSQNPDMMQPPQQPSSNPAEQQGIGLPQPAKPPGEFANLPTDPAAMLPQ